ncbi:MAG: hypothetical protein JJ902_05195 [Roseibium sp.]|nr:hypothetical protein [Roseibium sp.]
MLSGVIAILKIAVLILLFLGSLAFITNGVKSAISQEGGSPQRAEHIAVGKCFGGVLVGVLLGALAAIWLGGTS